MPQATPVRPDAVPHAHLTNGSGEVQPATTGSYCWAFPGEENTLRNICADSTGLLAPAAPLVVAPMEPLTFTRTPVRQSS